MNARIKTLVVGAATALILGSQAATATATVVVKQIDQNGRIIYTDRPDPKHVVLAQYRESLPAATSIDQPVPLSAPETGSAVIVGEPVVAPLTDVERAVRSFTRLASPLALTVDSSEASRRLREQAHAARNPALLPGLVFTRAEADTRTGTGAPPGLAARIFSPLFYLLMSLGVGFMAYLASFIFVNGLVPLCRELWPGMIPAFQRGIHNFSVRLDRWRHALPVAVLRH